MRLNPYQIMWLYVLFDLPVVEAQERREATRFRQFLLEQGFVMAQYSVYYKFAGTTVERDRLVQLVSSALPSQGRVDILTITDKQYSKIISFYGRKRGQEKRSAKTDPLLLF